MIPRLWPLLHALLHTIHILNTLLLVSGWLVYRRRKGRK